MHLCGDMKMFTNKRNRNIGLRKTCNPSEALNAPRQRPVLSTSELKSGDGPTPRVGVEAGNRSQSASRRRRDRMF
jgi:hypothetical protein